MKVTLFFLLWLPLLVLSLEDAPFGNEKLHSFQKPEHPVEKVKQAEFKHQAQMEEQNTQENMAEGREKVVEKVFLHNKERNGKEVPFLKQDALQSEAIAPSSWARQQLIPTEVTNEALPVFLQYNKYHNPNENTFGRHPLAPKGEHEDAEQQTPERESGVTDSVHLVARSGEAPTEEQLAKWTKEVTEEQVEKWTTKGEKYLKTNGKQDWSKSESTSAYYPKQSKAPTGEQLAKWTNDKVTEEQVEKWRTKGEKYLKNNGEHDLPKSESTDTYYPTQGEWEAPIEEQHAEWEANLPTEEELEQWRIEGEQYLEKGSEYGSPKSGSTDTYYPTQGEWEAPNEEQLAEWEANQPTKEQLGEWGIEGEKYSSSTTDDVAPTFENHHHSSQAPVQQLNTPAHKLREDESTTNEVAKETTNEVAKETTNEVAEEMTNEVATNDEPLFSSS